MTICTTFISKLFHHLNWVRTFLSGGPEYSSGQMQGFCAECLQCSQLYMWLYYTIIIITITNFKLRIVAEHQWAFYCNCSCSWLDLQQLMRRRKFFNCLYSNDHRDSCLRTLFRMKLYVAKTFKMIWSISLVVNSMFGKRSCESKDGLSSISEVLNQTFNSAIGRVLIGDVETTTSLTPEVWGRVRSMDRFLCYNYGLKILRWLHENALCKHKGSCCSQGTQELMLLMLKRSC